MTISVSLYVAIINKIIDNLIDIKSGKVVEFQNKEIEDLQKNFKFDLIRNVVTAQLPDKELTKLLGNLFKLNDPVTFSVEELPVEDTMKTFFSNPEKFL